MINLLIPLTNKKTTLKDIFEVVKTSKFKDEIFVRVLCEKTNPVLKEKSKCPCTLDVFPKNTSEDSMIFATTKSLEAGELIIVRNDCKFFTTTNLDKLITSGKNEKDIVMFGKNIQKNKIKMFFSNIFQKVCDTFFNFNFFDGDLGLMYFSARAHNILRETNVTAMTKINRWASVEIEYIEEDVPKSKICEKTPVSIPLKLGIYLALLLALIVGTIFLGISGNLSLLLILLFVCLVTSLICLSVYMILKWTCFKKIGEIYSKKVDILERRVKDG